MPETVRFTLLGPVRARVGDADLAVTAGRDRIVLAMLVLHAAELVPVQRLIDAIWGEQVPTNARNQIQGCVSRLRKRFADAGAPNQISFTDQAGYRLDVAPPQVDLHVFRRLRDRARTATADGRQADARDRYREALGLWQGAALAGIDSTLLRHTAAALDEEHVQAQEEYLQIELTLGGAGELVSELTVLVRQHPYREPLHGALMRALYRAGRQADALAAYRHARQLLRDELGVEPGNELQRLHQAILNRDEGLEVRSPEPAAPASPVPRELPAAVAGFTGRTEALAMLDDLVAGQTDAGGPVVISAIAGTAGVGKTALAIHWAHRVAERFPDGQLYLNLRGYASGSPVRPIEALAALLRSLDVPSEQIPADEAEAGARYRTALAGRRTLVVLDNVGTAEQVRPLLPGSPTCLVLVTSRDRLSGLVARDGAQRLTLDVLTADEARTLLTQMLGAERVKAEPDAFVGLAAACAYLPLALRIAAANIADQPARTIAAYVDQLRYGDRLGALQAEGDPDSSVLATLDLSYRTLPPEAARLYRLLGLVPGPDFTSTAAAALASVTPDDARRLLRQLTAAHLLDEQAPDRYTLHDLLRLYARRLAETEDDPSSRATAIRMILDHYLHSADAAVGLLYPNLVRLPISAGWSEPHVEFDGPADALAWLDEERANIVASITHAADHGPRPPAWQLADTLRRYLWHRNHTVDWLTIANAALLAADLEQDPQAQAATRLSLADQHQCAGDYPRAIRQYAVAAHHARLAGWDEGQAAALANQGIAHFVQGSSSAAAACYTEALTLFERSGSLAGQANNTQNLGWVHQALGQVQPAANYHAEALELFRQLGARGGEADALLGLGMSYHRLGRLEVAMDHLIRALALAQEVGDRVCTGSVLAMSAAVHRDIGNLVEALDQAQASVTLARETGHASSEADALNILGSVLLRLDETQQALELHEHALDVARRTGKRTATVSALIGLAAAHHQHDDHQTASGLAQDALAIANELNHSLLEGEALTLLAKVGLSQGDHRRAEEHCTRALSSQRETGHRLGEAHTLTVLGHIRHATGEPEAAEQHLLAARELFTDTGAVAPDGLVRRR